MMAEIFDQGKAPTEFKIALYFQALIDYDITAIERAATAIIRGRVYPAFPKPGEIIQEIEGSREDRAVIAWGEVIEAIRRVGPYQSVNFGDPTIHAVITFMGGWPATGEWTEGEMKWKQKEFERLYAVMRTRGSDKEYLPGIHEMENGGEISPVMIGTAGRGITTR